VIHPGKLYLGRIPKAPNPPLHRGDAPRSPRRKPIYCVFSIRHLNASDFRCGFCLRLLQMARGIFPLENPYREAPPPGPGSIRRVQKEKKLDLAAEVKESLTPCGNPEGRALWPPFKTARARNVSIPFAVRYSRNTLFFRAKPWKKLYHGRGNCKGNRWQWIVRTVKEFRCNGRLRCPKNADIFPWLRKDAVGYHESSRI
jgi:hypothetical protein